MRRGGALTSATVSLDPSEEMVDVGTFVYW